MELIDRVNGFGKIILTESEQQMLGEISEIASTAGGSYILGEMNEQTGRYERIMRDLFPMIPLIKSAGLGQLYRNSYHLYEDSAHRHENLPEAPELYIGSRIGLGEYVDNVNLQILMPAEADKEGYFMSVVVGDYKLGCIDDIVAKLGEREKPVIQGIQKIKNKHGVNPYYGIAEVPQLRTVLKLYEQATHLLRHAEDTIHVSSQELRQLREDMLKHENIAIRKISAAEYQKQLEVLTRQ